MRFLPENISVGRARALLALSLISLLAGIGCLVYIQAHPYRGPRQQVRAVDSEKPVEQLKEETAADQPAQAARPQVPDGPPPTEASETKAPARKPTRGGSLRKSGGAKSPSKVEHTSGTTRPVKKQSPAVAKPDATTGKQEPSGAGSPIASTTPTPAPPSLNEAETAVTPSPSPTPTPTPQQPRAATEEVSPTNAPAAVETTAHAAQTARPAAERPNALRRFFSWFIHLFKKREQGPAPVIASFSSSTSLLVDCKGRGHDPVELTAKAESTGAEPPLYEYEVSRGKVIGQGPKVLWYLGDAPSGDYTATVALKGYRKSGTRSLTVSVRECVYPSIASEPCPYPVNMTSPASVKDGDIVTFAADVGYQGPSTLKYTWTLNPPTARIISGAGTPTITVDSSGLNNRRLTAMVVVDDGSGDRACRQTAQSTTAIAAASYPKPKPRIFDEFPSIIFNDDKARLDNLAIELTNDPTSRAYVIAYGSCAGEAERVAARARSYLVNYRGIVGSRIVTVNGGCRDGARMELWLVPQGAEAPRPSVGKCAPCPTAKPKLIQIAEDAGGAEPSPTPSPEPGAAPPPAEGEQGNEQVTVSYPSYLFFMRTGIVSLDYDRVKNEVKATVRSEGEVRTEVHRLPALRGARPGNIVEAFEGYEAFVTARLYAAKIQIVPENFEPRSLDDAPLHWEWQITPELLSIGTQPVHLTLTVEYRDRKSGAPMPKQFPPLLDENLNVNVSILTNKELGTLSAIFISICISLFAAVWKVAGSISAMMAVVLTKRPNIYNIKAENIGAVGDGATATNVTQLASRSSEEAPEKGPPERP